MIYLFHVFQIHRKKQPFPKYSKHRQPNTNIICLHLSVFEIWNNNWRNKSGFLSKISEIPEVEPCLNGRAKGECINKNSKLILSLFNYSQLFKIVTTGINSFFLWKLNRACMSNGIHFNTLFVWLALIYPLHKTGIHDFEHV